MYKNFSVYSFVDMAQRSNAQINHEYEMIAETLAAIESGSELASQLTDQLDHEKLVLEQKKQVFVASTSLI